MPDIFKAEETQGRGERQASFVPQAIETAVRNLRKLLAFAAFFDANGTNQVQHTYIRKAQGGITATESLTQ